MSLATHLTAVHPLTSTTHDAQHHHYHHPRHFLQPPPAFLTIFPPSLASIPPHHHNHITAAAATAAIGMPRARAGDQNYRNYQAGVCTLRTIAETEARQRNPNPAIKSGCHGRGHSFPALVSRRELGRPDPHAGTSASGGKLRRQCLLGGFLQLPS